MILIVGKTATGKDTLANELRKYGASIVCSYTTRPRRKGETNTHRFITKEEASAITNRVAETRIGKYEYFVTADQLKEADVYIIDPIGVHTLTQNSPADLRFDLVYMTSPEGIAHASALQRGDKPEEVQQRIDAERDEFAAFEEELIENMDSNLVREFFREPTKCESIFLWQKFNSSVNLAALIRNDYSPATVKAVAAYLSRYLDHPCRTYDAVVKQYSFDGDVPVELYASQEEAIAALRADAKEETRISREENGYDYTLETDPHGMYAKLTEYFPDRNDITEWTVTVAKEK